MKIAIEPATDLDLDDVIRRSPVAGDPKAKIALKRYLKASLCAWTGLVDDEVACVWGLVAPTILSDNAYLWLLTTDLVSEHPFCFVRHSQMVVRGMLQDFPCIIGHTVAAQASSIRWLRWLGAHFGKPFGDATVLVPFELRRA